MLLELIGFEIYGDVDLRRIIPRKQKKSYCVIIL